MEIKNKIKILFVITLPTWGGAQRFVYDVATHLDSSKYDVTVAGGNYVDGILFRKLKEKNVQIKNFNNLVRPIKLWKDFKAIFEITGYIRKSKFDIVHLNSTKAGVIGSIAAKLAHCPKVIYTVHGFVFNEKLPFYIKKFYILTERFTAIFKDKLLTVSNYDYHSGLVNKIAGKEKFLTIYNGVDISGTQFLNKTISRKILFQRLNLNQEIYKNHFFVGTIANFYPNKGIVYLIEAVKEIVNDYPMTLFFIIGDGEQRVLLENLIRKHRLSKNILLVGYINEAEKYLKAFDLFVLSSLKEGLPYSIIEAQIAGVPIVATRIGGIPEIIKDNNNGLLVKPGDSKDLAEKIKFLIRDSATRNKFIEHGKQSVSEKFTLKKMVISLEKVYS